MPVISDPVKIYVHIRWMIRRDMPEVLSIEDASFDRPWTEEEFLARLRRNTCIGMVAELGERVVGFMVYDMAKTRLTVLDFAVHPEYRRNGIGRQMMGKLIGKLSAHRRTFINLEVDEGNLDAHLFFRDCGLAATGVNDEGPDGSTTYAFEYRYGGRSSDGPCP